MVTFSIFKICYLLFNYIESCVEALQEYFTDCSIEKKSAIIGIFDKLILSVHVFIFQCVWYYRILKLLIFTCQIVSN